MFSNEEGCIREQLLATEKARVTALPSVFKIAMRDVVVKVILVGTPRTKRRFLPPPGASPGWNKRALHVSDAVWMQCD